MRHHPSVDLIVFYTCLVQVFFFLQYKRLSSFIENVKEAVKQDKRLFFAFTKPFAEPASNVGIAEDDERNNKNVFTEVFCIKANK